MGKVWTNPNNKLAKPSCPEEEVGNIWYTHTFFVLKRSVLHSFLSLNTSLSYAFPQLTSNARVITLHNYRHFFLYCFSIMESSIASTPQNAFSQMKLNFMFAEFYGLLYDETEHQTEKTLPSIPRLNNLEFY